MLRRGAARSAGRVVLAFVLGSGWLAALADDSASRVWFSDHKKLKSIDTSTNQVDISIAIDHPLKALASDDDGNVWCAFSSRLTKFDAAGATLIDLDLAQLNGNVKHPRFLAVNPYRGSVWVASNHDVMLITKGGEKTAEWHAGADIEGIALDIDESLWVMGHRELAHISPSGALLHSVSIDKKVPDPNLIAVDGLGSTVWIVANQKLLKFDANQPDVAPQLFDLPIKIRAADVHPVFGTLWLAGDKQLLMYDRNGRALSPWHSHPISATSMILSTTPTDRRCGSPERRVWFV